MDKLTLTIRRVNQSTNDEAKQATVNFRQIDEKGQPIPGSVSVTLDFRTALPAPGDYELTLTPVKKAE